MENKIEEDQLNKSNIKRTKEEYIDWLDELSKESKERSKKLDEIYNEMHKLFPEVFVIQNK
jgi:hypothetical protein